MELHIPDIFFDSAKQINGYESLSEQISKAILTDILQIKNVKRGDEKKHEPDYISDEQGFEVTLGINNSLIPMLRGRRPLDKTIHNFEKELIDSIKKSLANKAKKSYSLRTNLIIFTLTPLLEWYSNFYLKECPTFHYWELLQEQRNNLFEMIIEEYLSQNAVFENVFIIQATHDEHYILYSVRDYEKDDDFMTKIAIREDQKGIFPRYRLVNCEKGSFPIIYEISEVLYK